MENNSLTTTFCDKKVAILTENADGEHYLIKADSVKALADDWKGDCNVVPANDAPVHCASLDGELIPEKYCKNFEMLLDYLMGRDRPGPAPAHEYELPRDVLDPNVKPFIFDDELTVEAYTCVNGYLWATNDLMKKLLETVTQQERSEGYIPGAVLDNPNFYANYFAATGVILVEATYFTQEMKNDQAVSVHRSAAIHLDKKEEAELISVMEAYCQKECGQSCLDFINEFRLEDGFLPFSAPKQKLRHFDAVLKDAAERAQGGGEVEHTTPQFERG